MSTAGAIRACSTSRAAARAVIKLSGEGEPEIYDTTRRFGTILENVAIDSRTRHVNLDDASLTEDTRAAYPISHIPNASRTGVAGHRRTSSC